MKRESENTLNRILPRRHALIKPSTSNLRSQDLAWGIVAVVAAFGTYFCTYGLRKPFTVAAYENQFLGPWAMKSVLVLTQVVGYTLSKIIGIKVIAEMRRGRRALVLCGMIAVAEAALVLFAVTPPTWSFVFLFVNGLMLGMVFGLVLGFLEGRRLTEALVAGLCASFILADGVTKSVGAWVLQAGVTEAWMPAVAGGLFLPPLLICVGVLSRVPPPSLDDQKARHERTPMNSRQRRSVLRRYWVTLGSITTIYLMVTVLRSFRADFAPELWQALGADVVPSTFSRSEMWVAFGVLVINGAAVLVSNNVRAFLTSLVTCGLGLALIAAVLVDQASGNVLPAFPFMVLMGLGLYLPYVAIHTTVFERFLAMTRAEGNIGYLMYVVDAAGYLGYVVTLAVKDQILASGDAVVFFNRFGLATVCISAVCLLIIAIRYRFDLAGDVADTASDPNVDMSPSRHPAAATTT
ncbi:DUF5690 family protein [Crateriforma spongiae]|uniref:DUF5690 family protein n=1 Tax=Crateriforma spongiae TaxID=2724528 RepID=UPI0039B05E37